MLTPQRRAQRELAKVDLLLVPTALHHYTVEEIQEEEARGDKVRHWLGLESHRGSGSALAAPLKPCRRSRRSLRRQGAAAATVAVVH